MASAEQLRGAENKVHDAGPIGVDATTDAVIASGIRSVELLCGPVSFLRLGAPGVTQVIARGDVAEVVGWGFWPVDLGQGEVSHGDRVRTAEPNGWQFLL